MEIPLFACPPILLGGLFLGGSDNGDEGGAGNDRLTGGTGADTVFGGEGDDGLTSRPQIFSDPAYPLGDSLAGEDTLRGVTGESELLYGTSVGTVLTGVNHQDVMLWRDAQCSPCLTTWSGVVFKSGGCDKRPGFDVFCKPSLSQTLA